MCLKHFEVCSTESSPLESTVLDQWNRLFSFRFHDRVRIKVLTSQDKNQTYFLSYSQLMAFGIAANLSKWKIVFLVIFSFLLLPLWAIESVVGGSWPDARSIHEILFAAWSQTRDLHIWLLGLTPTNTKLQFPFLTFFHRHWEWIQMSQHGALQKVTPNSFSALDFESLKSNKLMFYARMKRQFILSVRTFS